MIPKMYALSELGEHRLDRKVAAPLRERAQL